MKNFVPLIEEKSTLNRTNIEKMIEPCTGLVHRQFQLALKKIWAEERGFYIAVEATGKTVLVFFCPHKTERKVASNVKALQ